MKAYCLFSSSPEKKNVFYFSIKIYVVCTLFVIPLTIFVKYCTKYNIWAKKYRIKCLKLSNLDCIEVIGILNTV